MLENIKNATEFAFSDNVADMSTEIQTAIQHKIYDALQAKKVEVAQSFMNPVAESEEPFDDFEEDEENIQELSKDTLQSYVNKRQWDMGANEKEQKKMDTGLARAETKLKGDQNKLDKNKNGKLDSQDFKKLRKESKELEEKLDPSMGVKKYIDDFIKSDNPKFEGKSKKERMQMALGAYYAAKKGTNEEEYVSEDSMDRGDKYLAKHNIKDINDLSNHFMKKLGTNFKKTGNEKQYGHIGSAFYDVAGESVRLNRANLQKATGITRSHLTKLHNATDHSQTPYQTHHGKTHTEIAPVDYGDEYITGAEKKIAKKKETENEHN